ncbi:acyl-CoA dehydrogenase family protein [uncultured Pseudoteredinibacter sp.]|uniref:acyl-CoA dehydrogenase family protein n=1 Tax=uncultured Pseudoteredinibacter sp. TaxID=1641701 RepID=UPI0026051176|nr:acyl-CoA dehydrogenase family protein [uncultured Pseudoteredinibacter sp.]
MDFSLSQEQQMLQDSVAKFVQNDYDFDTRMATVNSDANFNQDFWNLFAELGWLMVPFSEEDGGMGGGAADVMVLMEEFGKGMLMEPYLANVILAGGLLAKCGNESQKANLAEIMAGQQQWAFAYTEADSRYCLHKVSCQAEKAGGGFKLNGQKSVVFNGAAADHFVVLARTSGDSAEKNGLSLFLVDANAEGVSRKAYKLQDGSNAAEVSFNNVALTADSALGEEGNALAAVEAVIDQATLAVCAEAVGAMGVSLEKTVEYTKTRVQFGVPISKFQALQHRMADMFVEHQQAKSMLLRAVMLSEQDPSMATKAISAAKYRIGTAARNIGQESVQIHGGIAVTDELDVGHYFKRLTMLEMMFGNSDYHAQRYQALA